MRYLFVLLVCSIACDAVCQENPALMELVNAEKSFAAYATTANIRDAFVKFLDDSSKVFDKGKILNGQEVWRERQANDSMSLIWYPEFAEVAASGDFGYTTGPSQFRLKKENKEPDYKGHFSSIWKKNKTGEWKVLLDIGTPSPGAEYNESKVEYTNSVLPAKKIKKGGANELRLAEEKFIGDYKNGKGFSAHGSAKARYYRPNKNVVKGNMIVGDTTKYTFRNVGTGIASSGDLGYAFGNVSAAGVEGNYLRVWKKEVDGWKIVLDVENY